MPPEQQPLPLHFYNAKSWHKSLLGHYTSTHQLLPKAALNLPLASLARAIENVINIYGNFPETTIDFFKQTINSLFDPDEYYEQVYLRLREAAKNENKHVFYILADSLLFIRHTFEKELQFLKEQFSDELYHVPGNSEQEKLTQFARVLHTITKVHVNQVIRLIQGHLGQ